jgi:hypothetical protein
MQNGIIIILQIRLLLTDGIHTELAVFDPAVINAKSCLCHEQSIPNCGRQRNKQQ